VATLQDLDEVALALPEVEKTVSEDGRPTYAVRGKYVCFHRTPRPDAVDPETGERLDDVLVFRTDGLDVKELLLADPRGVWFTTPHWNGYPGILLRIRDLDQVEREELRDLVEDAWAVRAPKRLVKEWLAAQDG
jgi:hypothetical protein